MIFISIPKTATQSIHQAIGSDEYNHYPIHRITKKQPTFTVVRNPYRRILSWYNWHRLVQPYLDQYKMPFSVWVKKGCPHHWDADATPMCDHPLDMHEFVCIDGEIAVDHILRFENLKREWRNFALSNGFRPILKREGVSHKAVTMLSYTPELKQLVYNRFKTDFELFNYQK